MFEVTGAFSSSFAAGPCGPFSYNDTLYAIAISARTDFSESSSESWKIGIFKSEDGETWTQTGGERVLGSPANLGFSFGAASTFGTALHVDFPDTPYIYVAWANTSGNLVISIVDLSSEDWLSDIGGGPDVIPPIGSFNTRFFIEQDNDSYDLVVLWNQYEDDGIGSSDRTYTVRYSSGWGAPAPTPGQMPGFSYRAAGLVRGSSGRIHAIVWREENNSGDDRILHFLARGSGGGIGSAFDLIASGESGPDGAPAAIAYGNGEILVAFWQYASGLGNVFKLSAARAASADIPAWNINDIDAAPVTGGHRPVLLISQEDGKVDAIFRPAAGDGLNKSTYNGSVWPNGISLISTVADLPNGRHGGIFYTEDRNNLLFMPISEPEADGCGRDPRRLCDQDAEPDCDSQGVAF